MPFEELPNLRNFHLVVVVYQHLCCPCYGIMVLGNAHGLGQV